VALAGPAAADAAVEVPFATQFASSGHGDVTVAANTLMTCPASGAIAAQCLAAREGVGGLAALNNNGYAMERVDVDGDAATFDSSTATLTLPAGATVTFAGLYYGARTSKGAGAGAAAAPEPAARGKVLLRAPGALTYTELSAAVSDSAAIAAAYTGFVDVTAQVAAAGAGEYTVADVQAGTGEDRYGGWSLIVAYSDPAAAPRSIRVYGGLASIVASEAPLQIAVTGLETPPAGAVSARVGVVAYEGDRGSSGDSLSLAGQKLTDAANPANNVFNSSISVLGANAATKNPNYVNQLGFDADLIGADGFLANGATEATLEESTNVEQYLTQAVAVSVQLDPEALEPPVAEPPVAEPPPAPPASPPAAPPAVEPPATSPPKHGEKGGGSGAGGAGSGGSGGGGKPGGSAPNGEPAMAELDVAAPSGEVRPTAVVPVRVTVAASAAAPLRHLVVCNRLGPGLTRLRAEGADASGAVACWRVSRLAAGTERTFLTTARVDASRRGTLATTTTVRAAGARTRRERTLIHVAPLPRRACGSSAPVMDTRLQLRC
jgi:hypothetical protein